MLRLTKPLSIVQYTLAASKRLTVARLTEERPKGHCDQLIEAVGKGRFEGNIQLNIKAAVEDINGPRLTHVSTINDRRGFFSEHLSFLKSRFYKLTDPAK